MFIGREKELEKLNDMYHSDKFEFAVIYGRRRVGKTTLIREFCKDKKAIYFVAREANDQFNLESFSKDVLSNGRNGLATNASFRNWEDAFTYIYNIAKDERVVLVIDEYPYLASSNRSISSIIQAHIDMNLKESKLFLILCGSSMSFMEYQVLGYKSPLYGRRTAQMKIKPFVFKELVKYYSKFTNEEKAVLYGITGGIPEYMSKIKENKSIKQNIMEMFLDDNGHLFEEPSSLLKQELREPAIYNSIITAIAKGATKLNEISTKCGLESNKCGKYLTSLMSLGIIRKDKPVGEELGKKSIYVIEDNMFKFWYRFVPDNMTNIVLGNSERLYDTVIGPQIPNYMGAIFEQICIEYITFLNSKGDLLIMVGKIGRWWGGNKDTKRQEEIDIFATDNQDGLIICECKWTNEKVDKDIIENLIRKGDMFPHKNKYHYIFAKIGFTDGAMKLASERVILVSYADMMKV